MKKFLKLKLPRLTHSGHFHTNSDTADHPGSGLSRNSRNLWGPLIADCISSTAPRPPSNSPTNWAPLDSVEKSCLQSRFCIKMWPYPLAG